MVALAKFPPAALGMGLIYSIVCAGRAFQIAERVDEVTFKDR
jgi:hypothetical protein